MHFSYGKNLISQFLIYIAHRTFSYNAYIIPLNEITNHEFDCN
jgi:hypothetical protein